MESSKKETWRARALCPNFINLKNKEVSLELHLRATLQQRTWHQNVQLHVRCLRNSCRLDWRTNWKLVGKAPSIQHLARFRTWSTVMSQSAVMLRLIWISWSIWNHWGRSSTVRTKKQRGQSRFLISQVAKALSLFDTVRTSSSLAGPDLSL